MISQLHFIGYGLIGASLSSAIRRYFPKLKQTGESADDGAVFGKETGFLDEILPVESLAPSGQTLVIIASPMSVIPTVFRRLGKAGYSGWVTDVGSVKSGLHREASAAGLNYFGGHPMAGSEKQSARNFNPFMFENAVYVLTFPGDEKPEIMDDFQRIIETIGALPLELKPDLHDEIAATISHLPQLLAVSLVNFAVKYNAGHPAFLQLAAGGFRDMTRIASSPAGIWKDILSENRAVISSKVREFISLLSGLAQDLEQDEDLGILAARFKSAKETRDSIPRNTKGFISPLFDLLVFVEDQPGVIYNLSRLLFEQGINIRDIELLKVREGLQGAFRISFSTEKEWKAANSLLNQNGFQSQFLQ